MLISQEVREFFLEKVGFYSKQACIWDSLYFILVIILTGLYSNEPSIPDYTACISQNREQKILICFWIKNTFELLFWGFKTAQKYSFLLYFIFK